MEKNLDKSFVIFRCGLIITMGLIMLTASVALNIIIIQEIHIHTEVMGWSILIIIDFIAFLFFMCIVRGPKVVIFGLVISDFITIQEIHTHAEVMGWSMIIIIDFLFFMCSIEAAKVVISLLVSYDDKRIFKSSREEMAAERKSTMRRIAKAVRHWDT